MATITAAQARHTIKKSHVLSEISWTLVAAIGSIIFIFPFVWMISTSVKPRWEQLLMPPKWIPSTFVWQNYVTPLQTHPFGSWYFNTLTLAFFNLIGRHPVIIDARLGRLQRQRLIDRRRAGRSGLRQKSQSDSDAEKHCPDNGSSQHIFIPSL